MNSTNRNEYIGDGVYVVYDGFGFILKANDFENPSDSIYLEPEVLKKLNEFVAKIKDES